MSAATLAALPEAIAEAIHHAAELFASMVPAEGEWTVELDQTPTELPDARVMSAPLGTGGRLSLLMAASLARGLIVGPPPADSLAEALVPGFTTAAAQLGELANGGSFDPEQMVEGTAADAMASMGGTVVTVRFIDGTDHRATMVFVTADDLTAVPEVATPTFDALPDGPGPTAQHPVSVLSDVEMGVTVELGRARMTVGEILALTIGSVIELDRIAGSPVDVLVNGTLIARGEVVVVDEEFGVRVSEVLGYQPSDRQKR